VNCNFRLIKTCAVLISQWLIKFCVKIYIFRGLVNPSEEKDGSYDGVMLSSQPNLWIILSRYNYIVEKGEFWSSGTGSGKG